MIEPGRVGPDGQPTFHAIWSIDGGTVTTAAERNAFEAFIDLVTERVRADPNLHVYHYAPYEPTAVKRLALPCTRIQGWTNQLPPCSVTAWSIRTRYYRPFVRLSRKLASSGLWRRRR